jgi:hypothetical protein
MIKFKFKQINQEATPLYHPTAGGSARPDYNAGTTTRERYRWAGQLVRAGTETRLK